MMNRIVAVVVLLAVLAAGGGWWYYSQRDGSAPASFAGIAIADDAPLRFVPADTPFVLATLAPLPDDVVARWERDMQRVLPMLEAPLDEWRAQAAAADADPQAAALLALFERRFSGRAPREAIAELGVDLRAPVALYGLGAVPVLRLQLADPARAGNFLAELETASGTPWPQGDVDGQRYWQITDDDGKLAAVVAIVDRHLVASVVPVQAEPAVLRQILGLDRPATSIADSDVLAATAERYGLLPYYIGQFRSAELLRELTGPASAIDGAFLAALGIDKPQLDAVCASEWQALAEAWPGFVVGYTRLDAERIDARTIVQMRADLAGELQTLRAPMPGAAAAGDGTIVDFGMAFALGELPKQVGSWADRVARTPWQCESLQPLNAGFAGAQAQVVNPMLYAAAPVVNGFHVALSDLTLADDAAAMPEVRGRLVIGSPNPAGLLGLAGTAVPQFAGLQLPDDGTPQPLPTMPELPVDAPIHVAMTRGALGLSIGAGEEQRLAELMRIDPAQQPVMLGGVNGRFYQLIAEQAMRSAAADGTDADAQQAMQRMATQMQSLYGEMIERAEFRVEFTEHGIELLQKTTLH